MDANNVSQEYVWSMLFCGSIMIIALAVSFVNVPWDAVFLGNRHRTYGTISILVNLILKKPHNAPRTGPSLVSMVQASPKKS